MYAMIYKNGNKETASHAEAVAMGIEKYITFVEVPAPIGSEEKKFNEKATEANRENRARRIAAGLPVRKKDY